MLFRLSIFLVATLSIAVNATEWNFTQTNDDFTDGAIYSANYNAPDVTMMIRCKGDDLDMVIGVGEYIGGDYPDIRIRFDKGQVHSYTWDVSTNGNFVFARADSFPTLVKGLQASKTLLVEVTKYTGTKYQRKIALDNISEPLSKVLSHCPNVDNKVSKKDYDAMTTGLSKDVKLENSINKGPRNVICAKTMLSYLGYPLKDMSGRWTKEYFYQLQKFINDYKSKNGSTQISPYSVASEKNPDFVKKCGYIFGFD